MRQSVYSEQSLACSKYSLEVRYYQVGISVVQIFNNSDTLACLSSLWPYVDVPRWLKPHQWLPTTPGINFQVFVVILHEQVLALTSLPVSILCPTLTTIRRATGFASSHLLFIHHHRRAFLPTPSKSSSCHPLYWLFISLPALVFFILAISAGLTLYVFIHLVFVCLPHQNVNSMHLGNTSYLYRANAYIPKTACIEEALNNQLSNN